MSKQQPHQRADYRAFSEITTRWMDNDVYGHVNNVVYYSYFDTAVNGFLVDQGVLDFREGETVGLVVETGCQFFSPLAFPDRVTAGIRVARVGTSSVRYEVGLFANDSDIAAAQVCMGLLVLVWTFTWSFRFDSPGLAISVYMLTVAMAIGFGLCLVFLAGLNKWVLRVVRRLIMRTITFTSGIFFATFELQPYMRPFVTWNPILHAVELFRYSINNQYPIPDISLTYLACCSMLLLGFSLILYRTNESLLLEANED